MTKLEQKASCRIRTPEQIVDSLLNGQYDLDAFTEQLYGTPNFVRRILTNLVDRVRPLQLRVRALECQIEHLKTMKTSLSEKGEQ